MAEYWFNFADVTSVSGNDTKKALSNISNGTDEAKSDNSTIGEGVARKAENFAVQQALSPLNSVTGGLATPAYQVGKSILSGAGAGVVGGAVTSLVLRGIQLGISKIEERVAKMEAKASELNERDNQLIKAGFRTEPTFYESSFWGVKTTDRR